MNVETLEFHNAYRSFVKRLLILLSFRDALSVSLVIHTIKLGAAIDAGEALIFTALHPVFIQFTLSHNVLTRTAERNHAAFLSEKVKREI